MDDVALDKLTGRLEEIKRLVPAIDDDWSFRYEIDEEAGSCMVSFSLTRKMTDQPAAPDITFTNQSVVIPGLALVSPELFVHTWLMVCKVRLANIRSFYARPEMQN